MADKLSLSELVAEIEDAFTQRFEGKKFWITAEITDVKKQPDKRWCFLKFMEKDGSTIKAEIKGVFWSNSYQAVELFEKLSGRQFASGLEITCCVRVRFHKRFGLDLEVLDIDQSYAIGKLELERQQTLMKLLAEHPNDIRLREGQYYTRNQSLKLPIVIQNIALITAPNSDGQRDFLQELQHNSYGYHFAVTEYLTQVQGDNASQLIIKQLQLITESPESFDAVAIVRGGGSQLDFKSFDDYTLAHTLAAFPLPIFTGIGHDRNTSIADMMVRQFKTPTKVAAYLVDYNFCFEKDVLNLKNRIFSAAKNLIGDAKNELTQIKRTIKAYNPISIINKGYAIIKVDGKIVTNPKLLKPKMQIETIMKNETITSTIDFKNKSKNEL